MNGGFNYLPKVGKKSCPIAVREAVKLVQSTSYPSKWANFSTAYIAGYGNVKIAQHFGIYAYTS